MKMTLKPLLAMLSLAMSAGASLASGTHAGGHGHDESAIGQAGVASAITRTVQVEMSDAMRFTPASVSARQGETIRFVIRNAGAIKHEFVLGTEKELKEHYEVMKKFPEMEHSDPNMITLAGGETGEIIWQFTQAGKVDFACLQPGHYDAGMKGKVSVAKTKPKTAAPAPAHKHEHAHE